MRASFDDKNFVRTTFYSLWSLLLALQSYFVELRGDEAYYWRFSQELAWGYFDHPPVTPFLIKIGYSIFQNELGVRLLFILMITATIWTLEKLVNPDNLKLFYAIVLSLAFLQIGMVFGGGMFAIPDFPLLFFTATFFFLYKKYLDDPKWWTVLLLSVNIALLLLSKYHGILVIGFTVLSNLKLFTKRSFWLIVVLSTALLLPHVYWQIENDFPSMRFHLFERSSKGYSISYTLEYLATQPFIVGPLIGILLLYVGFIFKPKDAFERSLKFLVFGTYIFFFFMTFKGSVEANWTVITIIPLLYGCSHIEQNNRLRRLAGYSFMLSVPLILFVRASITWNSFPAPLNVERFFGAKQWSKQLKEKSKGLPAAFMNSYQKAALYQFYSGIPAFSLNNSMYRKNQYTTWDTEANFQGKDIVLVANYSLPAFDSIYFSFEYLPYTVVNNFRAASNLHIHCNLNRLVKAKSGDTLEIELKFQIRNGNQRDLESNPDFPSQIIYSFFQKSIPLEAASGFYLKNEMVNSNQSYKTRVVVPTTPGEYDFYLSVGTGWLPPGINSDKVKFVVE